LCLFALIAAGLLILLIRSISARGEAEEAGGASVGGEDVSEAEAEAEDGGEAENQTFTRSGCPVEFTDDLSEGSYSFDPYCVDRSVLVTYCAVEQSSVVIPPLSEQRVGRLLVRLYSVYDDNCALLPRAAEVSAVLPPAGGPLPDDLGDVTVRCPMGGAFGFTAEEYERFRDLAE